MAGLYVYLLSIMVILFGFFMVIGKIFSKQSYAAASDLNPMKNKNKPERNYTIRFDSVKEKYYITNAKANGDEDITNAFGFRKYYKEKFKAEYVLEKLNE